MPRLGPGAPLTGVLIAACFALLAQSGALLGVEPIWDDAVFLARDVRLHELSTVFTAWGDSFFGPLADNEMYRPLVNASIAFDWWLSGSTPEQPVLWWFHFVNMCMHAANAGLAYLFLANATGRKLGAPLLAACLFAVHPLAVEPTNWIVGRCDLLATMFGLISGTLLLRSPANRKLVVPALIAFGLSLFAKATTATLPLIVALAVTSYRGLPPKQLFGRRHLPRFALFAVPLLVWIAARTAVLGAPFPQGAGRLWHDVSSSGAMLGVGRAFGIMTWTAVLPARLCGDYHADAAFHPDGGGVGFLGVAGLLLLVGAFVFGGTHLRRRPKVAFGVLAFAVALVPVLQVVPIGAVAADRFMYFPMLFVALLVGEAMERMFMKYRTVGALATVFLVFLFFGVQSHLRARAWRDPIAFNTDVLRSYPGAREATQRLALAYDRHDRRDDAIALLAAAAERVDEPDWELHLLGALQTDAGDLDAAEATLRRALATAGGKRELGARVRYNLAVVLRRTNRLEEARALLDEALALDPDLVQARTLLDKLTPR